jgi:transposase InsO family protein
MTFPLLAIFFLKKTYHALTQHYYWGNMTSDVHDYVTRCPTCQRMKPTKQQKPPLHTLEVPSRPFDQITLDWMTIGCRTKEEYDSVLCIVDKFTKWAIVIPCDKHMGTEELIDTLYEHVFSWIGLPSSIVGDRDTRLTAGQMNALCRGLCIKLELSTAYHPQTDGQTEQFNSTLLQMLRCFVSKYHTDWQHHIPALLYAYRNNVHSAIGYTPHFLLFGSSPRDLRAPLLSPDMKCGDRDIEQWLRDRKSEFKQAQLSMEAARNAMIRAHKAASFPTEYKVGDKVKVSTDALPVRCPSTVSPKLQPKYSKSSI